MNILQTSIIFILFIVGLSTYAQTSKIQVVEKNGNINVILSVTKQHLDKYEKLAGIFKEGLDKLDGVLSVNVALTSENQVSSAEKSENRFQIENGIINAQN